MITTMKRFRLLTFASLAVLSACAPPDAALRVNVTVRTAGTARVRADCLKLTISNDTQELKSLIIKRPADDTAVFAVRRGTDLPGTVKVQASGYIGSNCSDETTLKLNAQGEVVTGVFPQSGVTPLEIFVDPPNSSLDADHDGFVSAAKGGLDCDDTNKDIFPGAGQVCANNLVDTDCNGLAGCDDPACGSAQVCADPPDRVLITTAIATMLRYECRGPFRVELRNPSGPRLAIRNTPVALTASLAGVSVHATASCSDAAISSLPIAYGQSFFEVYLKTDGQAFGITTLEATAAQVPTPGRVMVEVHPQPIDHLEFTSPPRTVSAGTCSTETVDLEFRDAMNRRTDVDAPTTVTLSSMPGDLLNANIFFSDPACATDGSMKQLAPGQGAIALHIKAKRAGNMFTLTGTPSQGAPRSQTLIVQAAAAKKLAFTNAPLALTTTQSCSAGLFTVQLQDAFDNPVTTTVDMPIVLAVSGLSNVTLYDTSTMCTAAAQTNFIIPARSNSVSLRARGMTAPPNVGDITATAANGALLDPATQVLRISAGFATRFVMTGSAQSPVASACSGNAFQIDLQDAAGNPASSLAAVNFSLTTLPVPDVSFHFYGGAGCPMLTDLGGMLTVPPGQTSAQFYFKGNKAITNFEIRANSTLTAPTTFLPGNSIRAGVPGKLVFQGSPPPPAPAGTCTTAPYLAALTDLFDNPTSFPTAQTVTVSSNPAGPAVGTSTCTAGNTTVPLAAGSGTVSFVAGHTVTGPYALTASVNGFSTAVPTTLNVTPGPSTLLVDVPAGGGTTNLTAGACQQITLGRRDFWMNLAPTSGTINLGLPAGTFAYTGACPGGTVTSGGVTSLTLTNAESITFFVKVTTVGSPTITATLGAQVASIPFSVGPGLPTLQFEAPASGTAAITAGTCATVTLVRKDPFGNDVALAAADTVVLGSLSAGTAPYGVADCGGTVLTPVPFPSGAARVTFLMRATLATMQTIQLTVAGQSVLLNLNVSPGAPLFRVVPTGPVAVIADACVSALVDRRDTFGNLVPLGAASNLTFTPTGAITAYASTTCTGATTASIPMVMGASSQSFGVKSTVVGSPSFLLSLAGQTTTLGLTVSAAPTARLQVEGLPATLTARGCTGALTVRRLDAFNNDVTTEPGLAVTLSSPRFSFSTQSSCMGAALGGSVSIANGVSTSAEMLYATANFSGSALATANATAPSGPVTGSASTTIVAGAASKLVLLDPGGTVVAGACSSGVRVELRDQDDNVAPFTPAVASFTVGLGSAPGTPTFSPQAGCTGALPLILTPGAPVGTFSFRPTTAPSTETITASGSGVTSATQLWTVNTGLPNKLAWKTNPVTPAARFTCVSGGVIQLLDSSNNVTTANVAYTVTPTPNTPSTSGVTYFADATCTTTLTTLTIGVGASETAPFYLTGTGGTPVNLTATSTPVLTAAPARPVSFTGIGSLVVTPVDPALEAGACIAVIVTRNDAAPAAFTRGTTSITLNVATPASVTLHLISDCSDAAQVLPLNRVIAEGASTTVVYARGRSVAQGALPVDVAFTAVDALGGTSASASGSTNLKVYPLVRRGACNIVAGQSGSSCPLTPALPANDISRSFLIFTSTGSPVTTSPAGIAADEQAIECHLDITGAAAVACTRSSTGGNSVATMSINYQVVSWGRDFASGFGMTVQHLQVTTGATSTAVAIPVAVTTTGTTFVLTSSKFSGQNDGDAFPVVRLTSTSNVEVVTNTTAPHNISIQVVSFAGSTVTHTNATAQAGAPTVTVTSAATLAASTFVLATAQVSADSSSANQMCKRRLKGQVSSATDSTWRRGANASAGTCSGDPVALINVQRVSLPGAVVRVAPDVTLTNSTTGGTATFATALTAIHKSVVLMGLQGPGGQTSGEGAFAGTAGRDADTGSFHASLDLSSTTQVSVTRTAPSANATSAFSVMGVQFDP